MEKGIVYINGIKNTKTGIIQDSTSLVGISKVDNSNTENLLSLGQIDIDKKTMHESVELILCKPSKEEIAILNEAYNRELSITFNDVGELSFSIPYYIQKQYEQVINPNWELIKEGYLVKIEKNYYTIDNTSINGDTQKEVKNVQCYSLEYQLTKRKLRGMFGTRQLYKGLNDGVVVNIKYSLDGSTWNLYTKPFEIIDNTTVNFQTLDMNSVVLNSFIWNANNKINETQGLTINSSLIDIVQGSITKKLLISAKIISEIGEGILNILESETTWKVGYIDRAVREDTTTGQNHRRYRTFDIKEKSWLEVIKDDIQKAFGCFVFFDTDKKELNIYKTLDYKVNKGLYISEENYIKSIKKNVKDTEIVTRLHVFGKDNISISTINPTGQTYIENFDYYRSIKYMPQDLLNALDNYFGSVNGSTIGLLNDKSKKFTQFYAELQDLRFKQLKLENEKADLDAKYKVADNDIDYAIQSHNKDNTLPVIIAGVGDKNEDITKEILQNLSGVNKPRDLSSLNAVRDSAKKLVDLKQMEIEQIESNIEYKLETIITLKNLLAKDRTQSIMFEGIIYPINFTKTQVALLDEFVKEDTWQKDIFVDFFNAYELLSEGIITLKKLSKPRIEFELDIIDLLNIIDCQKDWDKINIGDIVNIYYDKFNIAIEARLIKINHNIDENSLSVTISTDDELDDPAKYLSQIAGNANNAKNSIDIFKHGWDLSMVNQDQISQIIGSALDTAKNRVLSGRNQNIEISERGISMKDMFDDKEQLRMLNNVIAFTTDGWETCSTAITPYGIVAQEIYGKIVGSNRLIITNMNDSGESSFLVDANHMKAINMDLSLLNKSQTNRIYLNPEIGIKIQKKIKGEWGDVLWLGMDGRIQSNYMVTSNLEIKNDEGDVVLNSETNYLNIGKFATIVDDGLLTPIEKMYLRKEWIRIQVEYPKIVSQAKKYKNSSRDSLELVNTSKLQARYLELDAFITPLLREMTKTTTVDKTQFDTVFGNYYSEVKDILAKIEDSLKYSSLQLGEWYNHVVMDAINGITVTKVDADGNNEIARTILNATTGITIAVKKNGIWEDNFWVDMNGRLQCKYMIATNLEIKNDGGELLLNSKEGFLNVGKFETITMDGMLSPLEKISVRQEWLRIQNEYPKIIIQATKYNTSERDNLQLVDTSNLKTQYSQLDAYITPLLLNMENPSPVTQSLFDVKFGNYYSEVKLILNKIEDSLKYSSLQLGGWYNNTVIDAINGITVTKVDADGNNEIAKTVLNATTGISISTKKKGVWEDNFWVDTEGNLIAKNLMILDEFGRPAFVADDKGELDLEGRLRVMRYLDDTVSSKKIVLIDIYKDDPKGGKILVNNWEGKKNIFMGSSPDSNYNGGFLKMYNDEEKPRIEFGTYTSEDAGRINLMGIDDKAKISLSAIDDEGDSAGVIKLFDKNNNPMIFISSDTSQNTMSRHNAQITIGKTTNTPKVGLYGGHDDFGGFIELSDKYGIPNLSMGDISLGTLGGGMQVFYANMGSNTHEERISKRRVQVGVFNGGSDGQVQMYNSSGDMIGRVSSEGGVMSVYGKEKTCFIKFKENGDIDIDAGSGNVNIKGTKINLN
ncbi:phage tail protein [Clostridium tagluense]|uniref:Prophage tail endopeptidase domain-containing protein n=1 Tax=Clostridium tagluense TaxID=360422 RepID=A0A401UQK1_9CLOT|nr:hypothetical protein [Clostridium tagluense]GCD11791.1 hypothetical protein Ctaglu_34140 [Clostridium tagluense]